MPSVALQDRTFIRMRHVTVQHQLLYKPLFKLVCPAEHCVLPDTEEVQALGQEAGAAAHAAQEVR